MPPRLGLNGGIQDGKAERSRRRFEPGGQTGAADSGRAPHPLRRLLHFRLGRWPSGPGKRCSVEARLRLTGHTQSPGFVSCLGTRPVDQGRDFVSEVTHSRPKSEAAGSGAPRSRPHRQVTTSPLVPAGKAIHSAAQPMASPGRPSDGSPGDVTLSPQVSSFIRPSSLFLLPSSSSCFFFLPSSFFFAFISNALPTRTAKAPRTAIMPRVRHRPTSTRPTRLFSTRSMPRWRVTEVARVPPRLQRALPSPIGGD